jgi:hypothetical protein
MIRCLHRLGAITCVLLAAGGVVEVSETAAEETSLLYLAPDDWRKQAPLRKVALAADFMRIFCADPTMSPASLADCLDREKTGAPFERAIACASAISAGR